MDAAEQMAHSQDEPNMNAGSQAYTSEQYSILRQAASILQISVEDLPQALKNDAVSAEDSARIQDAASLQSSHSSTTPARLRLPGINYNEDAEPGIHCTKPWGKQTVSTSTIPSPNINQSIDISPTASHSLDLVLQYSNEHDYDHGYRVGRIEDVFGSAFDTEPNNSTTDGYEEHNSRTLQTLDSTLSATASVVGEQTQYNRFELQYTPYEPLPPESRATLSAISRIENLQNDIPSGNVQQVPNTGNVRSNPSRSSSSSSEICLLTPISSRSTSDDDVRPQLAPLVPRAGPDLTGILENVHRGPCSKIWHLPKNARQRRKENKKKDNLQQKGLEDMDGLPRSRRRGPFDNQNKKTETALTRRLKACVRCRMQKLRCEIDPANPHGSCLTCLRLSGPTLTGLPCLRYKITDASLFRDQSRPNPYYTQRWQTMEMVNITEWASSETKTIELTHDFGDASFSLRVRPFIPIEGDELAEMWADGGALKRHQIPPYAIIDMEEAAQALREYVDSGVASFIVGALGNSDRFYWDTYLMAFKYSKEAPTDTERNLIVNALRLWVMARMTSNAERICGNAKLGTVVEDPSSPYYGKMPVPPLIVAQFEIICTVVMQRPLTRLVLDSLHALIKANKRKYWFTIYLTLFVLLHSCSMTTRRDGEYASQMLMNTPFANLHCIAEHHVGVLTMLAHFHYVNKGSRPFTMARTPAGLQELAESAGLNAEQAQFVATTSRWVHGHRQQMQEVREQKRLEDDLYFLSQLFEEQWEPSYTAQALL